MGLFDKKECAVCGKKVGLLGARKVEDGTICSDCTKKLSPFFSERKHSSVEDIKKQLAYREKNKEELNGFIPCRIYGYDTKIFIDFFSERFCISQSSDYRAENADLIDFSQVTRASYRVEEDREEIYLTDSQGNERSYNPPKYEYTYEFYINLLVNSPYFSEIEFELIDVFGEKPDTKDCEIYLRQETFSKDIVSILNDGVPMIPFDRSRADSDDDELFFSESGNEPVQNQNAPTEWICPNCGSSNNSNFCENCGSAKP